HTVAGLRVSIAAADGGGGGGVQRLDRVHGHSLRLEVGAAYWASATFAVTDRPGRNWSRPGWPAAKRMRTGTRCTILVKLPVPGSKGSSAKREPEPGARLSTVPVKACPGSAS